MEQLMRGAALNPNHPLGPKCSVIIAAALLPLLLANYYELSWSSEKFQYSLTNYARSNPVTPPASMWRDVPVCGSICKFLNKFISQSITVPVPFTPVALRWAFTLSIRDPLLPKDTWNNLPGFLAAQPLRSRLYIATLLSIPRTTLVWAYLRDFKDAFPLLRQELDVEKWRVFMVNPLTQRTPLDFSRLCSNASSQGTPAEGLAPVSVFSAAALWSLIPGVHITFAAARFLATSPIYASIVMVIAVLRTVVEFSMWVRLLLFLVQGQFQKAGGTLVMAYGVPMAMTLQALLMMNMFVWFIPSFIFHFMCGCFILWQPLFNTVLQCSPWLCDLDELIRNPGEVGPALMPAAAAAAAATAMANAAPKSRSNEQDGSVHWPPALNIPPALHDLMDELDSTSSSGSGQLEVPLAFLCPITHVIMRQPAVTCTGASYEQAAIAKWFMQSKTDPLTQIKLTSDVIFPNLGLRCAIEEWLTKHAAHLSRDNKDSVISSDSGDASRGDF